MGKSSMYTGRMQGTRTGILNSNALGNSKGRAALLEKRCQEPKAIIYTCRVSALTNRASCSFT